MRSNTILKIIKKITQYLHVMIEKCDFKLVMVNNISDIS